MLATIGGPMNTKRRTGLALGAALLVASALAAGSTASSGASPAPPSWALHGSYAPVIKAGDLAATIDNPYFPLRPGTGFHYRGVKDGKPQTDNMVVTHEVKYVLGVKCVVVEDTVSESGRPVERTFDWYAQDKQGNVWYM